MTNWKSAIFSSLIASTAMFAIPGAALAQDADGTGAGETADDGAIVVTGLRQQYRGDVPLTEIPQTVQTLDGAVLKELNITGLADGLDLASGISRQNSFGGLWDSFAIRGFAGDENFPSGFLVNGFNGGRGYGGTRDASNIERIEILKGPNGAVFGRGEPGGTINITTKKADLADTFGSFAVSAGSFETYRVEADYNLALSDTLAVRVNGAAQDAGSFRDTVESNKVVASPSILWAPTNTTKISYEMEYVDNNVPFERGVVAVDGKLGLIPNSRFLGEPGDGPTEVDVLGHQLQFQQQFSRNWFLLVGAGYRDTSFVGFSSDAELAAGRQTIDNDGENLARQRRFRDYGAINKTIRGELSGKLYTGPLTHHVLVGADYDVFKLDLFQTRIRPGNYVAGTPITAASNAINIYDPVYGQLPNPIPPAPGATYVTDSDETQKAWGIYFQDQIDITERLKLRLGGRFDHFNQRFVDHRPTLAVPVTTVNVRERFSPTVGVLYELTDTLGVYAAYGEGFRPNSGVDPDGDTFVPETSTSYEAGLRFTSNDDAINATLAVYSMKKDNILTSDPAGSGQSVAAGAAKSKGLEADVTANLPGDLSLIANYAYTDAEWSTTGGDKDFGLAINPGDPLINIPKHQANLLLTKGFDLGTAGRATIGGGVNYVSKRLGETGTDFYLPGYTLVRAMASYEPDESVRLSVNVTNVLDETYYPASYHRWWVMPGAPRAITGRVDFFF
ncbi:TonB-dependent siderophore receptor [Croceicoccus ponticola]|uniref:TonB-dependent siderophore receptor n=1 Tax=Croceicoccus ponticola TaxID=2217664 RepID=A0A437H0P3_9SPHN|nr:TonB-dependent siderophore receptor [Croceicoccus ponticola]RVQ69146.1 TonB-dependent siderophore receptor [Croceicoccus ponticola]